MILLLVVLLTNVFSASANFGSVINENLASAFQTEAYVQPGEKLRHKNETIQDLFGLYTYPPEAYRKFIGLDYTALFSSAVSINEQFIIVGSNGFNIFEGIVHVYTPISLCEWTLQSYIRSPVGDNANFGVSVAIDGQRVAVGANAWQGYTGKAFMFTLVNDIYWELEDTLVSPLTQGHGFGHSVALSGQHAVVGSGSNSLFIYQLRESGWTLTSQLTPPGPNVNFGRAVAISGHFIVAGAEAVGGSVGQVLIYRLNVTNLNTTDAANNWYLFDTLGSVGGHSTFFGHSVDISGNTLVVGAKGFEPMVYRSGARQTFNNSGWAYLYDFNSTTDAWSLSQEIVSPVGQNSYFGQSVAIKDNSLIVGADGFPFGNITGSAFTFRRNTSNTEDGLGNWAFDQALPSAAGKDGHFGYATDISDTFSAVGAYGWQDLRGGIFLACRGAPPPTKSPVAPVIIPDAPTMRPTTPTEQQNFGNNKNKKKKNKWPIGVIVAMMLGGVMVALAAALIIYCCCCCCIPPAAILKKKKKKKDGEEGDSTYTVHGPGGLIDEDGTVYGPEFRTDYSSTDASSIYSEESEYTMEGDEKIKKGDKKGKKGAAASKFKVHSYAGYQEETETGYDENRDMELAEKNKASEVSEPVEAVPIPNKTVFGSIRSKFFVKPKTVTAILPTPSEVAAEEAAIYHPQQHTSDSFFENDGMDESEHDHYNYNVRTVTNTTSTSTFQQHTQSRQFSSQKMYTADQHNQSMSSLGSDDASVSTAGTSLVDEAKARLAAYKAKIGESGARSVSSASTGSNDSANRAGASYASYKMKLEEEDRRRTEEAALIRSNLEQTRLAAEAADSALVADQRRAEQLRLQSAEEEFAAQQQAILSARQKAEEEARVKFAQFKARQEQEAQLRLAEEMNMQLAVDAARLRAEREEATRRQEEEAFQAAADKARSEEENRQLAERLAREEEERTSGKARSKDEARLRAEEKARERYAAFKAKAESDAQLHTPADAEGSSNEAVERAKAKLAAINAQLAAAAQYPPPAGAPVVTESVVNNVVNVSSSTSTSFFTSNTATVSSKSSTTSTTKEVDSSEAAHILELADDIV